MDGSNGVDTHEKVLMNSAIKNLWNQRIHRLFYLKTRIIKRRTVEKRGMMDTHEGVYIYQAGETGEIGGNGMKIRKKTKKFF